MCSRNSPSGSTTHPESRCGTEPWGRDGVGGLGGALAGGSEGGEEKSEGGGQHQGTAAGLEDASGHEQPERRGHGTQRRGRREDAQPDEEGALAAGPVGPPSLFLNKDLVVGQ